MNLKNAFVSVIIPVFNGELYIKQAIDSILAQSYKLFEVIIVDDGSVDRTERIVASFKNKVHYVVQNNKGASAARNHGLKLSRGDFIAFLDSDDLWPENKLNLQVRCLIDNPKVEVLLGGTECFRTNIFNVLNQKQVYYDFQMGSALFRKSVFDKVGSFDEKLKFSEDYDWFFRAKEIGIEIALKEETTLFHRRHKKNITNKSDQQNYQLPQIIKKSLNRRRTGKYGAAKNLPRIKDFKKL